MGSIDGVCEGHRVQLIPLLSPQVWINTSDIILVGLRDYQVGHSCV